MQVVRKSEESDAEFDLVVHWCSMPQVAQKVIHDLVLSSGVRAHGIVEYFNADLKSVSSLDVARIVSINGDAVGLGNCGQGCGESCFEHIN